MDGLSVAASIIAVLQLTGEVVGYLKDIKDCPKECQQCMNEASNLNSLLINLLFHLNQKKESASWYAAVEALDTKDGPIFQYKQALEQLLSKVDGQAGLTNVKKRLQWKFKKAEVASILARFERLKGLISIALEMDHL
jgi:hypothetical protein